MLDLTALDVAIGLTFVYLILSLLCTGVNEWWSRQRGLRSQFLKQGIHRLLGAGPSGNEFTQAFYNSPLIRGITRENSHPSYLSPRMFALALVDAARKLGTATPAPSGIRETIDRMPAGDLQQTLAALLGTAKSEEEALQKIEAWFSDGMDRVSGWYKRHMQTVTLIVAAVVTILANADTLAIVHRLWIDPAVRDAVVAHAQARAKEPPPLQMGYVGQSAVPTPPVATPAAANPSPIVSPEERDALTQLLTWSSDFRVFHRLVAEREAIASYRSRHVSNPALQVRACLNARDTVRSPLCSAYSPSPIPDCEAARKILTDQACEVTLRKVAAAESDGSFPGGGLLAAPLVLGAWLWWLVPRRIVGWLLTIFAISLGAPFWFGALQKLVNIRSSGVSPAEKKPGTGMAAPATGGGAG